MREICKKSARTLSLNIDLPSQLFLSSSITSTPLIITLTILRYPCLFTHYPYPYSAYLMSFCIKMLRACTPRSPYKRAMIAKDVECSKIELMRSNTLPKEAANSTVVVVCVFHVFSPLFSLSCTIQPLFFVWTPSHHLPAVRRP